MDYEKESSNYSSSSSLKDKLKQTLCLSCCFRRQTLESPSPSQSSSSSSSSLVKSSSTWIKTDLPEIKDKCRNILISGGRTTGKNHHRRYYSTDFRYDPLSYSLNFEDGFGLNDEAPLKSFSSRLPPSPEQKSLPVAVS